ncbi:MAG: hypothetical protein FWB96_07175 [Defluviitaleaceae bacterium]|nr:hypothetical protein [Defluviitaleaceae bacterium]MCL2262474.1 hypothetical protein [Defluviitaleaceae bacterium]
MERNPGTGTYIDSYVHITENLSDVYIKMKMYAEGLDVCNDGEKAAMDYGSTTVICRP